MRVRPFRSPISFVAVTSVKPGPTIDLEDILARGTGANGVVQRVPPHTGLYMIATVLDFLR